MLKKILFALLIICLSMTSFHATSIDKPYLKTNPVAPLVVIQLSANGTITPGSTAVRVEFDFETSTNTINAARIYSSTDPCNPLESCVVTSISGGPINFAGGAWRVVNSIVVSCAVGTVTIGSGTVLIQMAC